MAEDLGNDDLVLDEDDLAPAPAASLPAVHTEGNDDDDDGDACEQPIFQTGGGDASMIAKEADKETAGASTQLEAPPSTGAGGASPPPDGPASTDAATAGGRPTAKAVLVGDSGVGKTALLTRFAQDIYREASKATIGVDLHTREVALPGGKGGVNMQLWDTAGQEQFHSMTTSYFRQAHAVVLVYDVHSTASFGALSKWMVEVDRHAPAEVVKMIVGTKTDGVAGHTTAVSEAEAAAFASKHGALCERCSAKEGTNVKARSAARHLHAGMLAS